MVIKAETVKPTCGGRNERYGTLTVTAEWLLETTKTKQSALPTQFAESYTRPSSYCLQ